MGILVSRCRRPSRWSCVVPLVARVQVVSDGSGVSVRVPPKRISRCPDVIEAHEKYERGPMPIADVWTKIRPPPPPLPKKLPSPDRKLPTQHQHPLDSISSSPSETQPSSDPHSHTALAPDVLLRIPQNNSCFGYDIRDVDAFLAEASLEKPANIPMVLCRPAPLFRWPEAGNGLGPVSCQPAQPQLMLPLGMVVNGVFRHKSWLYAQTPHGHEGFIRYNASVPLGILPSSQSSSTPAATHNQPCWESASDIFPQPRAGYSAARKMPLGTRSERGYCANKGSRRNRRCGSVDAEKGVDKLYLRTLQQRYVPPAHNQLKPYQHDFGFL